MSQVTEAVKEALRSFDQDRLVEITKKALAEGHHPQEVLDAITAGLREIGDKFEKGEFFLVELVTAGEAAKTVITEHLKPLLKRSGSASQALGHVVMGTVAGDIHDIGKGIVASMLFTAGFEVTDLGVDVPAERFVEVVRENDPDVVGMSALLTTTLPMQRATIEALGKNRLRDKVKVIVGGSPVTDEWAKEIGADGYAEDAIGAVKLVKRLLDISD
jgi:corrinoid protein of di/trimethylamine methyltransferase